VWRLKLQRCARRDAETSRPKSSALLLCSAGVRGAGRRCTSATREAWAGRGSCAERATGAIQSCRGASHSSSARRIDAIVTVSRQPGRRRRNALLAAGRSTHRARIDVRFRGLSCGPVGRGYWGARSSTRLATLIRGAAGRRECMDDAPHAVRLRVRRVERQPERSRKRRHWVSGVRLAAVALGSAICGSGVALGYDQHRFQSGMSAGAGSSPLAAVVLSGWRPVAPGRGTARCVAFAALDGSRSSFRARPRRPAEGCRQILLTRDARGASDIFAEARRRTGVTPPGRGWEKLGCRVHGPTQGLPIVFRRVQEAALPLAHDGARMIPYSEAT